jgi:hypothetical protein
MAKSEDYVSGEQFREMSVGRTNNKSGLPRPVLAIIVVVVLMGLSFYGGVAYQKGKQPKSVSTTASGAAGSSGFAGRGGGRFGGQRPTIGSVTAISGTSITVQDSNSGTSTTLAISSSTQITDNGQAVAASDIQTGDTVLVSASTTDKTQAARILVNPSFGGGGGGASSSGQSDSSTTAPDDSGSALTN